MNLYKLKVFKWIWIIQTISLIGLFNLFLTSCSNNNNDNVAKIWYDQTLKEESLPWYKQLTNHDWNKNSQNQFVNYFCESEQQAIALYSRHCGSFWNEPLHQNKEPKDVSLTLIGLNPNKALPIKGLDYKFMQTGISKSIYPRDDILYHGVEYMEVEFWDQLKDYIVKVDNTYDYSKCIGKTIESYGFISTTLNNNHANSFFNWRPYYEQEWKNLFPDEYIVDNNPLKEPTLFKIHIKKSYEGAGYLADFDLAGFGPDPFHENQVIINRYSKYLINNIVKENNINIWDVSLL